MKKKLSELEFGEAGVILSIPAPAHELNCLGVRERKRVKMVTRQPIRGPVVVAVDGVEVAMGIDIAGRVLVEVD
jgi:ferrous iron transport protein A